MDRIDALRLFFAVAEYGSFAEAARARGVSASRASRAVASLEQTHGATLLRRTTRHVSLTDEGARFLEKARFALAELDEALDELSDRDAEPRGTIAVAASLCFGRMHVLPVLSALLRQHPQMNARLQLLDRVVSMPEEGVDIAVRIGDLPDSGLHARRLGQTHSVLAASPAYLAAHGHPATPAELRNHALIAFEGSPGSVAGWRFRDGQSVGIVPRMAANNVDACIGAAIDGVGIVRCLSYQVAAELRDGRLVRVLHADEPAPVPIHAVYQAGRLKSRNISLIVDRLCASLSTIRNFEGDRPHGSGGRHDVTRRRWTRRLLIHSVTS